MPMFIYTNSRGSGNIWIDGATCILYIILLIYCIFKLYDVDYKIKCKLEKIKENKINKKKEIIKAKYRKDAEELL